MNLLDRSSGSSSDATMRPRRALIVKLGAIGDVAMAIPAVGALYDRGFAIDWVVGTAAHSLLKCYSWVNPIVLHEQRLFQGSPLDKAAEIGRLWKILAGRTYGVCANLHYDLRYRSLTLAVRSRVKVHLSKSDRRRFMLAERHHSDEYLRILMPSRDSYTPQSLSPRPPDHLPPLDLPKSKAQKRAVLVPAGAKNILRDDGLRRWPLTSYVQLAADLIAKGWEVVLSGGTDDHWVEAAFRDLPINNQIGRLSIGEVIRLYDQSDVVVTHDTGPLHLAGLTSCAVIGIFGPTNPWGRLPRRANTLAIWGGEGFGCRPCYDGKDYASCEWNGCLAQISPALVLRELEKLVEAKRKGDSEPPRIFTPRLDAPDPSLRVGN